MQYNSHTDQNFTRHSSCWLVNDKKKLHVIESINSRRKHSLGDYACVHEDILCWIFNWRTKANLLQSWNLIKFQLNPSSPSIQSFSWCHSQGISKISQGQLENNQTIVLSIYGGQRKKNNLSLKKTDNVGTTNVVRSWCSDMIGCSLGCAIFLVVKSKTITSCNRDDSSHHWHFVLNYNLLSCYPLNWVYHGYYVKTVESATSV